MRGGRQTCFTIYSGGHREAWAMSTHHGEVRKHWCSLRAAIDAPEVLLANGARGWLVRERRLRILAAREASVERRTHNLGDLRGSREGRREY